MNLNVKHISKIVLKSLVLLLAIGGLWYVWNRYFSPTRIAFVNYQVLTLGEISKANDNPMISLEELPINELDKIDKYDMVFINGMGIRMTEEQRDKIQMAAWTGTNILTTMSTNPTNFIVSVDSLTSDTLNAYLRGASRINYRSMLNYIRTNIDQKLIFCGAVDSIVPRQTGLLSHPNLDDAEEEKLYFQSIESYEDFLKGHDLFNADAPRVLVTGAMGDPSDLILALEKSGNVVYRAEGMIGTFIKEWGNGRFSAVINLAHGRLGDEAVEWLFKQNCPLFCPLNVNCLTSEWENDKQGMQGGFMSQSIVTPELDGAIRPYVIFGQRVNEDGMREAYTIPDRLEKFVATVNNYIALQQKKNAEKRVAIVYFKGPGESSLTASGLDVVPSLMNVLRRLQREGYTLKGLPSTSSELAELFNRQQRSVFGNVALVQQPLAGEGDNTFAIIHGTDKDPIDAFQQAYYWIHDEFKADVMIHFGTHGGLEYTPRKQVALCSQDWPDRLVGTLPHLYIYTIGNVGEALIAKRRTYAGIQSHLNAPYLDSGLRGQYKELNEAIAAYNKTLSDEASRKVKRLAVSMGIHRELELDSLMTTLWTEAELARVEQFGEEIVNEKMVGQCYTLGVPYEEARIVSSIQAMATDPIAYGLHALAKRLGRVKGEAERHRSIFTNNYLEPAKKLVARLLENPSLATDAFVCQTAGISAEQLAYAREIAKSKNAPTGMMAMMSIMMNQKNDTTKKESKGVSRKIVEASSSSKLDSSSMVKMKEAGKGMDPKTALQLAKMAGASPEALKKMAAAMGLSNTKIDMPKDGVSNMMKSMADMKKTYPKEDVYLADAIMEVERTLLNVGRYRQQLKDAPEHEMVSLMNALSGGYTKPSSGGDVISNPHALPTGRNLYGINAENTPSEAAWEKGMALANNTIKMYQERHHDSIPRKVSFTFWSSEFIETEGATIAQALYLLGVEPLRDAFGRVTDLRLIPSAELKRPRVDVVVQTSGQFRDLASSRLYLINRAVQMAAEAKDGEELNFVQEGVLESERLLVESGVSPREAREMSSFRIFGGLNGDYGTGIQGMVQQGSAWKNESEIAETYLNNMSAFYGSEYYWEQASKAAFRAALSRTDVVVQPRQSNAWGALSLDHVYEFMGGMNLAVRNVTGKDPDAYFADYRNRNNNRMQELKEAIGVESRTTIFNPNYIKEKMKGGANEAASFAEIVENTYGWNVMKPMAIDNGFWEQIYNIYIEDGLNLGVDEFLHRQNPAAFQSMAKTMIQTAQKGYWKTTPERLEALKALDSQLQKETDERQKARLDVASEEQKSGMVMKRETNSETAEASTTSVTSSAMIAFSIVAMIVLLLLVRKRKKEEE